MRYLSFFSFVIIAVISCTSTTDPAGVNVVIDGTTFVAVTATPTQRSQVDPAPAANLIPPATSPAREIPSQVLLDRGSNNQRWNKANFPGVDFAEYNLAGIWMNEANLEGANLAGQDLTRTRLSNANLKNADLSNTNIFETDFSGARLIDVELSGAIIVNANFVSSSLSDLDLSLTGWSGGSLRWAKIQNVVFPDGVVINGEIGPKTFVRNRAIFSIWDIEDVDGTEFNGSDLTGAVFAGISAKNTNFSNAILSGADLRQTDFTGANFSGADLTDARLIGVILQDADLTGATITDAALFGAKFCNTTTPDGSVDHSGC